MTTVGYESIGHLIRIPVKLATGHQARFILDTGIGISVVHSTLAARAGLQPTGSMTNERMSGQTITSPLTELPSLGVGGVEIPGGPAAIVDMFDPDGPEGADGLLGLDILGGLPYTIDPFQHIVTLGGQPDGDIVANVAARPDRDGSAIDFYVDLRLPNGTVVPAEVDTGSGSTILADRYMAACGVDGSESTARVFEVVDETGNPVMRRFIPIPGTISIDGAPETAHTGPTIQFQEIALDALVGTSFLNRFIQTYDTRSNTITLRKPAS